MQCEVKAFIDNAAINGLVEVKALSHASSGGKYFVG
jgi:hypothetical protein